MLHSCFQQRTEILITAEDVLASKGFLISLAEENSAITKGAKRYANQLKSHSKKQLTFLNACCSRPRKPKARSDAVS